MIGASWISGHASDRHPRYTTVPPSPTTGAHATRLATPSAGFAGAILTWGEAARSEPSGERRASEGGRSPPPSASASKVRLDHALVRLDHPRRALGDLLAVVEHEHVLAEPHHDLHVVLDEQDRLALVAQPADRVEQVV